MPENTQRVCRHYHRAVELIGRRWTGAVLQVLLSGRRRYCEIRGAIPEVSDRMLSERLKELEAEGIALRIVTPDTPVRVEYELTPKGRALEQALGAIAEWAEEWKDAPPGAAQDRARAIRA
jgi:DNA-binding HxlR family transcriptional regulator